jgi:hypothetical protein
MKGKLFQEYHLLLVKNQLEEFEQQNSSHFFCYYAKKLPLYFPYLDWLVIKIRPIRKQQMTENYLYLGSVSSNSFQSFTDRKKFFCLLQFLIYVQKLDFTRDCLGSTSYRQVVFRLQDFFKY